jgi:hypothetical protein
MGLGFRLGFSSYFGLKMENQEVSSAHEIQNKMKLKISVQTCSLLLQRKGIASSPSQVPSSLTSVKFRLLLRQHLLLMEFALWCFSRCSSLHITSKRFSRRTFTHTSHVRQRGVQGEAVVQVREEQAQGRGRQGRRTRQEEGQGR